LFTVTAGVAVVLHGSLRTNHCASKEDLDPARVRRHRVPGSRHSRRETTVARKKANPHAGREAASGGLAGFARSGDTGSNRVKLGGKGEVVIPRAVLQRLALKGGETLLLEVDDWGVLCFDRSPPACCSSVTRRRASASSKTRALWT
jgi:bifunctional DNA-binding transcriptional regulator/antitoxin component of YhaV-PrlF toxin-antitoxin module